MKIRTDGDRWIDARKRQLAREAEAASAKAAKQNRKASKRVGCGGAVGPRVASAKVFDTEKPIPATDLADMREAGVIAPSQIRRQKASAKSRQPRPNVSGEPRAKRVGSGPWLGASGASTTQGAEPTRQANDHP